MTDPHPSIRQVAEDAVADGATHPEAKQAALDAQEHRANDIDLVAHHAVHAAVYLIRDGGLRGSYNTLDDATWAEVVERVKTVIGDEVTAVPHDDYEAAVDRLAITQDGNGES